MQKKISELNEIGSKFEELNGFEFLQTLDLYIQTIINDDMYSQVVDLISENHERESIRLLQEVNRADSEFDNFIRNQKIQPEIDEKYPSHAWKHMLNAQKRYALIKDYKNESEIPDVTITLSEEQSELGTLFPSKINLSKIPLSVDLRGWRINTVDFHKAMIAHLEDAEKNGGILSKWFHYDTTSSSLYFEGIEVQINERKRLTNAHYLLEYLFKNSPFQKHFIDELLSEDVLDNPSWKSYYDACVDIQKKVKVKANIDDFLDFNSGDKMYLRINPEHSFNNDSD